MAEEKDGSDTRDKPEDGSNAESGSESRSKIPLMCGMLCIVSITVLLMITEWLTDASVMLLRWRLCLLCICMVPFVMMSVGSDTVAKIVSVISLLCILVLCVTMYCDRNEVIRMYAPGQSLGDSQAEQIGELMKRPVVLLLGGATELPASLAQYNQLGPEFNKKLSGRMKPSETPTKKMSKGSLSAKELKAVRYSGIAERVILLMPDEFVNDDNHKKQGYKKLDGDQ